MPNLEKQFQDFLEKITLTKPKKESLRTSRNNDRDNITKYFLNELKRKVPTYHMQGSFKMDTVVNPMEGGEYDLDDGVYLQCLDVNKMKWESATTVHKWVCDALSGITSDGVEDKDACVRLIYKKNYHIDFPIYGLAGEKQYLAHKSKNWTIESYPKELTSWFQNKTNESPQIKNLVRYIKAWKDFKQCSVKLPSGMILTILMTENYIRDDEDQYSFLETCRKAYNYLNNLFVLYRPVQPYENLLESYSETRKKEFLNKLNNLIEQGDKANQCDSEVCASECWQKVFGDRFPKAEEPKESAVPAIIGAHAKSA